MLGEGDFLGELLLLALTCLPTDHAHTQKMSRTIEPQAVRGRAELCEPGNTITNYMYPSVKGIC